MDVELKTFEQKEEYHKWRQGQMNLSLVELAKGPNCGFHCVGTDYEFSCGCSSCGKATPWVDGEITRRMLLPKEHPIHISEEGVRFIEGNRDSESGFLRADGCILPRKWRPEECLRVVCNRLERLRNN